jgi:uncharacterized protein involved in exopolysaccharide biosynthesis
MYKRKQPKRLIEIIDIRKKTVRKIKLVDKNETKPTILPIKNNKDSRSNIQRKTEHNR